MSLLVECPPSYPPSSRLLFLGEAPGEEEVRVREGFRGVSGRLLEKIMGAVGLSRSTVAFSNVVKRRPPSNDFSIFYEVGKEGKKKVVRPTVELEQWIVELHLELKEHSPAVVVCFGNEALSSLIGLQQIGSRRGSCYPPTPTRPYWVVAALHPAAIYHGALWQEVAVLQRTLERAAFLLAHHDYQPRGWNGAVVSCEEAVEWIAEMEGGERWSLDLETYPEQGRIHTLGLAMQREGETAAICCSFPSPLVWEALQTHVRVCGGRCVNQNIAYDMAWLKSVGVEFPTPPLMDTMQAFHVLYPELPKSLGFITTWLFGLDIPYYKDEGKVVRKKMTPAEQERYYNYNMTDAVVALWASYALEEEMRSAQVWRRWEQWHRPLWGVGWEMQEAGLPVALNEADRVAGLLGANRDGLLASLELQMEGGNPASGKQVMGWLSMRGVTIPPKKRKGRREATPSVDEDSLIEIHNRDGGEVAGFVRSLLEYRKLEKNLTSYLEPMLSPRVVEKGVVRSGWIADSTETFRFASHQYPIPEGFNAQTLPKELRYLVIPPAGRVFISADLSQAEARYVAARSKCPSLLSLFNDPTRHIHMERAREIFGHAVQKDSPEYVLAKSSLHAGNYRMTARTFAQKAAIPLKQASAILEASHRTAPEVRRWHEEVKIMARQKGVLENCWGIKRGCYAALGAVMATGVVPDDVWRDLIAWEPQSAIPQQINRFLLWAGEELHPSGWTLHQHGHDSFLASLPPASLSPRLYERMKVELERDMIVGGVALRIPAELVVGWSWGVLLPWDGGEVSWMEWSKVAKKAHNDEKLLAGLCYVPGLAGQEKEEAA